MKFIANPIRLTVLTFLLTFACSTYAIAENAPTPASSEEDEIGIALTKSGYDKLEQGLAWKRETQRTDYYLDAFDGKSFLLSHLSPPYKLRLKNKEEGLFLQFSTPTKRESVTVKGVPVKVLRTKSAEIQCNPSFAVQLRSTADKFFANLDKGGPTLLAMGDKFNNLWCANENEISGKLKSILTTKTAKIMPAQENMKARLTMKSKLAGVHFKLFLEDKQARDSQGAWVHEYELEAEPRSQYQRKDLLDAATALGELAASKGLVAADLRGANPDATEYTLKQLTKE